MRDNPGATAFRPEADIMAEAREMQARHAGRLLGTLVRRLGVAVTRLSGSPDPLDGGRLTLH